MRAALRERALRRMQRACDDGGMRFAPIGLAASSLALALGVASMTGCLQDFDRFAPGGGGSASSSTQSTTTGTNTTTSSSSSSSSTGSSMMCDPPNCDDSDPCTTDTCTGTTCSHDTLADGTPIPGANLDMTDCLEPVCVGGMPTTAPNDAEMPSDGNDCTSDTCAGGAIKSDPVSNGTPCGAGSMCIGGQCGCNSANDCGPDDECGTRTCMGTAGNKVCGWDYSNAGTLTTGQVSGDCKKHVCTGNSEVGQDQPDNDPTNDNNACTTDACDMQQMTTHTNLSPGTSCGGGSQECGGGALAGMCCTPSGNVCAGKCGMLTDSCNVQKMCGTCSGTTPICNGSNVCVECAVTGDCTGNAKGSQCLSGACGCNAVGDCGGTTPACDLTTGSAKEHQCVECASNADCTGGKKCQTTAGAANFDTCATCIADGDCSGNQKCATSNPNIGTCVQCNVNSDCPQGMNQCSNHVCM